MKKERIKNLKRYVIAILCFSMIAVSVCTVTAAFPMGGNADAYTGSSGAAPTPASIGSLTLNNYASTVGTDGHVFDGAVLASLWDKILGISGTGTYRKALEKVKSSTSTVQGSVYGQDGKITKSNTMDFSQINGGNAITVGFGGYTWNVVYLTTDTSTGDLIATLWMSENMAGTYAWNSYQSNVTSDPYPSNMYSSSKIRVDTLNAGGDGGANFATSTTARNGTVSNRTSHALSQFTLSSSIIGNASLTDYLVTPGQVNYQQAENWVWSYNGSGNPYLCPNEAWGTGTDGTSGPNIAWRHSAGSKTGGWYGSGTTDNMNQVIAKTDYTEWKDDYVWLPSLTETGYYNSGSDYGSSLWGIPAGDAILKSSAISWLRSGAVD